MPKENSKYNQVVFGALMMFKIYISALRELGDHKLQKRTLMLKTAL